MFSTAAFHARARGSVPGLGGLKRTKMFLPHPRVKLSIVGSLRDREVACSALDRRGSNFEFCVWRTVSSQSSHHPQEVLLAQFSLYVHKDGLKPDSFQSTLWVKAYVCEKCQVEKVVCITRRRSTHMFGSCGQKKCWASVVDGEPALAWHLVDVLPFLLMMQVRTLLSDHTMQTQDNTGLKLGHRLRRNPTPSQHWVKLPFFLHQRPISIERVVHMTR